MSPKRPVEVRLAIAALAFLVAVVAVLGTWQVLAARSSQRSEIEAGEVSAAHLASSALSSALASRLELLSNLAGNASLSTIFTKAKAAEQATIARTLHLIYPGFASFDVISANGRLDARWPAEPAVIGKDVSSQAFFANVMHSGKPYISQAMQQNAPPKELITLLAAPVRDTSGRIVGILAASIPGKSLASLIGGTMLRDGGALVVFDQSGHAFTGPGASAKQSFASLPGVSSALAGRTGAETGAVPGLLGPTVGRGAAPVSSTGWVVVVEEPSSVLAGPIDALTERLAAIGLAVAILAAGIVALVASLLRKLMRERERVGALMASVGEGVATIDMDGVVQLTNPAMDDLTGWPSSGLVGKKWAEALDLYDQRGNLIPWDDSIAAQAANQGSVVATTGYGLHLARADGQRLPVAMTAAPLRAGNDLLGAVMVLLVDVSREA